MRGCSRKKHITGKATKVIGNTIIKDLKLILLERYDIIQSYQADKNQLATFRFAPAKHMTVKNADKWTNAFLLNWMFLRYLFRRFLARLLKDLLKSTNKIKQ